MMIKVTGKSEALKELEKTKALIADAEKILYRLPTNIGLELIDAEEKATTPGGRYGSGAPDPQYTIPCPKPKKGKMKIGEIEEKVYYADQEPYQVNVSFSISYHDWRELQNTPYWKQITEFLAQTRNAEKGA